jgi:hypothetical protein
MITRRWLLPALFSPLWVITSLFAVLRPWSAIASRHVLLVSGFGGVRTGLASAGIHGCTRCRGEAERTVRCWRWIDCDGSCRPDAGCLSLLKWYESGGHRAATSTFREKDVALRLLTSGNRWRP